MIIVASLVIIIGKPIAALIVVRMLRYPFQVAIAVAIALAQIGEFSFVLEELGASETELHKIRTWVRDSVEA
jgi:K+:H+ antiporter